MVTLSVTANPDPRREARPCCCAGKKKSHGWCDFAPGSAVSDTRLGYSVNDTLIVAADILVLNESVSFTRETELGNSAAGVGAIVSVRLSFCPDSESYPDPNSSHDV